MKSGNYLKNITRIVPVMFLFFLISCNSRREVTVKELQDHVAYLASDSLKGRLTGSDGDSLAAEYIRNDLLSCGFKPVSGDGFQRFMVTDRLVAGPGNSLFVNEKEFFAGKDFTPFAFSSNSEHAADVIFTGYGFNINTDSLQWNDYQGIDVKNKWVMILRADPDADKTESIFIPHSADRDKALLAKDSGAAGVLMVSGPSFDPVDTFESLNSGDLSVGIPVLRIKREVADLILSRTKHNIAEVEKRLNDSGRPFSFSTGTAVKAKAEVIREMNNTRNVVMILQGEDKSLEKEYLIMGAHFDHLGMGGPGSSSRVPDTLAIHYGADDNASGVGMMLELAEKFAQTPGTHPRSIVCIAFSGEEKGLLGSKYFVDNPGIDLTKVNAMINLDMVGRLPETNMIQISGTGTATGLRDLIHSHNDSSELMLTLSDEGYGPSDHSSFYGKDIPVLFYSTGAHLDYHTPYDTYDKVNYEGMLKISTLIFRIAEFLASSPEKLNFTEAGPKYDQARALRRKGVTLGIMPDHAGNVRNGLRADFVTPGRPAAIAGMKKGDIITAINGKSINNIQDYMFRMGQLEHGQTINVEIIREDEKIILLIQL
jgi:aminopeptidase YwaD